MEQMLESLVDTISIYGVGVHMIIAVFFAIHAMRRGQQMYWLWILFVFPFLGSVVYFFAMYLPNTRMEHNMRSGVGGGWHACLIQAKSCEKPKKCTT
jgi:hypothetical protein